MDQRSHPATGATYRARPASIGDPERLSPRLRGRRALTLVLLTIFLPGSAQLVAGNKRLGRVGLRTWLCALLGAAILFVLAWVRRSAVLALFTRSWFLALVTIVLVALALLWAVLFVDTMRLVGMRWLPVATRRVVTVLTVVGVLATSGGLLWAANFVNTGRGVIGEVFGGNTSVEPTDGRYNILLLGGDSGSDRIGTRPDSINLVSIDAQTGRSVMFGFARNTENIRFTPGSTMATLLPGGWACGDKCLLNALYTWGQENRKLFPPGVKDPGLLATTQAVEALSGLTVHYFVLVDLKGFESLVNAVGGLTIDVKRRTAIGGIGAPIKGYIEPGVQHLDGYHALWYARSRVYSDDFERMARQRCVLSAMAQQLNPTTVITKFQAIAASSAQVVKTSIPESDLGVLGDIALKARSQRITSVNFVPPLINPWKYDPQFVKATVANTIEQSVQASPEVSPTTRKPTTSTAKPTDLGTDGTKGVPAAQDLNSVCGLVG